MPPFTPTARRIAILAGSLALIVGAAACGGDSTDAASGGLEKLEAKAILARAEAAAKKATSVHAVASGKSDGEKLSLDARISDDSGAGTLFTGGITINFVVDKTDIYISGDSAFEKSFGGAASLIKGKYLKGSNSTPQLAAIAGFGKLDVFMTETLKPDGSTLSIVPGKTIDGIPTVGLKTEKAEAGILYVANDGTDLPLLTESTDATNGGTLKLTEWNKPVTVTVPPADKVVDFSKLGQ